MQQAQTSSLIKKWSIIEDELQSAIDDLDVMDEDDVACHAMLDAEIKLVKKFIEDLKTYEHH